MNYTWDMVAVAKERRPGRWEAVSYQRGPQARTTHRRGSHALFLHGQAIFLLLWPELECQITYQEGTLSFHADFVRGQRFVNSDVLPSEGLALRNWPN